MTVPIAAAAVAAAATIQEARTGLRNVCDEVLEPAVRVEIDFYFCQLAMHFRGQTGEGGTSAPWVSSISSFFGFRFFSSGSRFFAGRPSRLDIL